MKWMIASDIHGSAKYCRAMLARFDAAGAQRLCCWGICSIMARATICPRNISPKK